MRKKAFCSYSATFIKLKIAVSTFKQKFLSLTSKVLFFSSIDFAIVKGMQDKKTPVSFVDLAG